LVSCKTKYSRRGRRESYGGPGTYQRVVNRRVIMAAAAPGIWPEKFRIQRQPFLKPQPGVGLDRVDRALRLAHPAIAFT
jgi:hypothetical protein